MLVACLWSDSIRQGKQRPDYSPMTRYFAVHTPLMNDLAERRVMGTLSPDPPVAPPVPISCKDRSACYGRDLCIIVPRDSRLLAEALKSALALTLPAIRHSFKVPSTVCPFYSTRSCRFEYCHCVSRSMAGRYMRGKAPLAKQKIRAVSPVLLVMSFGHRYLCTCSCQPQFGKREKMVISTRMARQLTAKKHSAVLSHGSGIYLQRPLSEEGETNPKVLTRQHQR
nr:hypothetical protein CFP56_38785 [Quercus suber]